MKIFSLAYGKTRSEIKQTDEAQERTARRDHDMKTKRSPIWATTAFLVFAVLSGERRNWHVARKRRRHGDLGYPLYFITIIGFWKVLEL